MKELSSLKNPLIQSARALQSASERKKQNAFFIDGEHMVQEALHACPASIEALFVDQSKTCDYHALLAIAECEVYAVPETVLRAISQVKTSQGIGAICALPPSASLDQMGNRLLLLENVQDPGNVGTMLRTLEAAGFDGAILTHGCADPFSPKGTRATMGSLFRVPICFVGSSEEALGVLHQRNYQSIAAALGGEPFYDRQPLGDRLCVLIGNEGAGLLPATQALCLNRYEIPLHGRVESLNAGIAAAVMMYDLLRENS